MEIAIAKFAVIIIKIIISSIFFIIIQYCLVPCSTIIETVIKSSEQRAKKFSGTDLFFRLLLIISRSEDF